MRWRQGIGLLTEDRKQQGLCLHMSVRDNIAMAVLNQLTAGPVTNRKKEASLTQRFIESLNIKASSQEQLAINLSGGTQQKVVLSKWLATGPSVLIFDEPTRGIDVGAKVEIYKLINDLARQGVAILMISSELPEILGMSDRIMVIGGGRVRGFLSRSEATEERIMELATTTDRPSATVPQAGVPPQGGSMSRTATGPTRTRRSAGSVAEGLIRNTGPLVVLLIMGAILWATAPPSARRPASCFWRLRPPRSASSRPGRPLSS